VTKRIAHFAHMWAGERAPKWAECHRTRHYVCKFNHIRAIHSWHGTCKIGVHGDDITLIVRRISANVQAEES
jgi:hypothetical protein